MSFEPLKIEWKPFSFFQASIPATLQPWLNHAGSFIERLETVGITHPEIRILQQDWQIPEPDECDDLNTKEKALVREVFILTEKKIWMFARTVFSKGILDEKKSLLSLGKNTLGSILFQDKTIKRGELNIGRCCAGMPLYDKSIALLTEAPPTLWARRSLFYSNEKLLLTEVFLPDLVNLQFSQRFFN